MEGWGCTNSPRYHVDRFHTYRNCPKKRYQEIAERSNQSIQEYTQHNSVMRGIRGDYNRQGKCGYTSSMEVRSMFAERRFQIVRSWKEAGFGSLHQSLIMCEMMNPSISKSVWVVSSGALNYTQSIKDQL